MGVSVTHPGQPLNFIRIKPNEFRKGTVVVADNDDPVAITLMGCGVPIQTMEIDIRDEAGNSIPQPARGQIWIKGPSVTEGYWSDSDEILHDGWLKTGDEGFLFEGQVYVCGRSKDVLIRGGVNYDAHEIEDAFLSYANSDKVGGCTGAAVFPVIDEKIRKRISFCFLNQSARNQT